MPSFIVKQTLKKLTYQWIDKLWVNKSSFITGLINCHT